MGLEGFRLVKSSKEVLRVIPSNPEGLSVLLRFRGGVGDVLMGIGGVAAALDGKCHVTAAVQSYQIPLIQELVGVDKVLAISSLGVTSQETDGEEIDVRVDFSGVMDGGAVSAEDRRLPDEDYYKVVGDRAGVSAIPAKFSFSHLPQTVDSRKVVAIHPWASNPNRRWLDDRWDGLASSLVSQGFHVVWLGTPGEFGFNAEHIEKLSDTTSDLLWQCSRLASSHFFVGCDSGFSHVAGMLGIPGTVLFTSTQAKNVICRYPSLRPTEVFARLGLEPSRSFLIDDPVAEQVKLEITESQVLQELGLDANDCTTSKNLSKIDAKKYQIRVINDSHDRRAKDLISELSHHFDLVFDDSSHHATLIVSDSIDRRPERSDADMAVTVRPDFHVELVHRILRELINS